MNKNRIRLTESQLHRVIKESVNQILNEIAFAGESFHGDNPTDWSALEKYRNTIHTSDYLNNHDEEKYLKGLRASIEMEDLRKRQQQMTIGMMYIIQQNTLIYKYQNS